MTPPKVRDLTGQTFGKWTVLSFACMRRTHSLWRCQCTCGTISNNVSGVDMTSGRSKSCGCARGRKKEC